jgi:uncharacterized protein (TIGR02145 family)
MNRIYLSILFVISFTFVLDVKSQSISNIDYTVKGKNIEITYDLLGAKGPLNIEVFYSKSNTDFIGPLKQVSGAVGKNQTNGIGKTIIWDVLSEVEKLEGDIKFKLVCDVITYSSATVHYTGTSTAVVDVYNPKTGKTWMDRNLGATRTATSSTDVYAYGDLYQWGRAADGHQCRNSATTSALTSIKQPLRHGSFIISNSRSNYDWRSPQNDNLWQGVNGTNNPCPSGYRLPTKSEWEAEKATWVRDNAAGAFASPLKLPMAGYRSSSSSNLNNVGSYGSYWSSTVGGANSGSKKLRSCYLDFGSYDAVMYDGTRALGNSVRCIKD